MEAIIVLIFVGICILVYVAHKAENKKIINLYERLAQHTGGTFIQGGGINEHHVRCIVRGVDVFFDRYVTGSGDNQVSWFRAYVDFGHSMWDKEVNVYAESAFSFLGKALGGQDVQVGHPAFDKAFIVKSNDPKWLIHQLNNDLMSFHVSHQHLRLEVSGDGLSIIRKRARADINEILVMMDLAAQYALRLGPPRQLAHQSLDQSSYPARQAW